MVEILTRTQVMERMHISHTKMNRYLKDPEFPAVKDGVWYIFGDRIEDYLMKRKQPTWAEKKHADQANRKE